MIQEPVSNKKNVALFRMNSIISDPGEQLEGDEPQRQQWDSPVEFLMSCISMSVGLGKHLYLGNNSAGPKLLSHNIYYIKTNLNLCVI